MGHNIRMRDYPLNVNKREVQNSWDTIAANEDYQEGCSGVTPIRWLESYPISDSYEMAEERIKELDEGWYDCLAVRYYVPSDFKESAVYRDACNAVNKAQNDYNVQKDSARFEFFNRKSEFIGCKSCGSKLSLVELKRLKKTNCPLCGGNLLSPTVTDRLMKAHDRIVKAQRKQVAESNKVEARRRKSEANREIRWLVKIEYHT